MLLIYTGSYPDDKCGVGDYVYNLNQEIKKNYTVNVVKLSLFELIYKIVSNRKIIKLINILHRLDFRQTKLRLLNLMLHLS